MFFIFYSMYSVSISALKIMKIMKKIKISKIKLNHDTELSIRVAHVLKYRRGRR